MWLSKGKHTPIVVENHTDSVIDKYNNTGTQLRQYADNVTTDKDTWHSYLGVYETLFESIRETATRIMEIGVCQGGSIQMWSQYFSNAEIHGVDIDFSRVNYKFDTSRIHLHTRDAYTDSFVDTFELASFDVIIDDGPHTLDSMIRIVQLYPKLIKENGLLIIEDVQSADWIPQILKHLPAELCQSTVVFDRRHLKDRYDDIQIVIRNTKNIVGV